MGKAVDWKKFEAQILRIETLKDLRNEIIYVNRNAYVANRNYTPFSQIASRLKDSVFMTDDEMFPSVMGSLSGMG